MRVSLGWLQDYVNISLPAEELAAKLTMSGTEAEQIDAIGANWEGILVARVEALEKHPNADRLLLATVDLGEEQVTVVTGAPNLEVGQKVSFARVGAELLDGRATKFVNLVTSTIVLRFSRKN